MAVHGVDQMPEKLITFLLQGRNDAYAPDYSYRINSSINLLAESLSAAGLLQRAEILFVDWGSEVPLAEVVTPSPAACEILEFVHVPPDRALATMPDGSRYTTLVVNVGVRRAAGQYIMLTDTDVLWTKTSIARLGDLLDGRIATPFPVSETCFSVKRYQIPWETAQRCPSPAEWERYLALSAFGLLHECAPAITLGGFAGAQLMHRDLWHELRGYDENLTSAWGWADNDLSIRAGKTRPWLDTCSFGILSYHVEHRSRLVVDEPRPPHTINPMTFGPDAAPNGPDWGLNGEVLPRLKATPAPAPQAPRRPLQALLSPTWDAFQQALGEESVGVLLNRLHLGTTTEEDGTPRLDPETLGQLVEQVRGALGKDAVGNDGSHADLVTAVCAFCRMEQPARLHHFGRLDALLLQTAMLAAPGMEVYLAAPWPYGVLDNAPLHPGLLSGMLWHTRFRGYTRIVPGEPETMPARLDPVGAGRIECAIIDAASCGASLDGIVATVLDRLEPGGMVMGIGAMGQNVAPEDVDHFTSPSGVSIWLRRA